MVVDTSALVAIVFNESDAARFVQAQAAASVCSAFPAETN
jgi:uncharacterized protein with PIN domain